MSQRRASQTASEIADTGDMAALVSGLVDQMLVAYDDWREDAAEVSDCYARWAAAKPDVTDLWYAAYRSALDQEEYSANEYRQSLSEFKRRLPSLPPCLLSKRR